MGFWSAYPSSLKPLEVEEPVDLWVHRRPGYVVAKLALALSMSPDQLTAASLVCGALSGAAFCLPFPHHLPIGSVCLWLSAVLDCADGQLARMGRSSSAAGRMLDGVADGITLLFASAGTTVVLIRMVHPSLWQAFAIAIVAAATVLTSSFHTAGYDHYKNVFLHLTCRDAREGEDLETALGRYRVAVRGKMACGNRAIFLLYLGYLKWQRALVGRFDPYTAARLDTLPAFDPHRAAIYRKHALGPMRIWRSLYGVGSLVFGLAWLNALGHPDWFIAFRLVLLNAVLFFYLGPLQRSASRKAFDKRRPGPPADSRQAQIAD